MKHPDPQHIYCQFITERLLIEHVDRACFNIKATPVFTTQLLELLTPSATKELPSDWQRLTTADRVEQWWQDRLAESTVLLVKKRCSEAFIGLIFLYDSSSPKIENTDIHLGYLLKESTWGKGYASELLAGLILWCEQQGNINSLIGGVSPQNKASIRVLEKNGFQRDSLGECANANYFFTRKITNEC